MQLLDSVQDDAGCDNLIPDLLQKAEGFEEGKFVLGLRALLAYEGEEVALGVPNDEQHEIPVRGLVKQGRWRIASGHLLTRTVRGD